MEALELKAPFGNCFAGRRVLVTGHTGFKGSWLALWLQTLGAHVGGLALDPEGTDSHWSLLGLELPLDARVDLRDAQAVREAVAGFKPEIVFHLAAQALVRRSYREPADTFAVNIGGLVNLLEAVRTCDSVRVVVNATTDKVYEPPAPPGGYRETHPLGGHDPYSASKACAEIVSASYRRSYFSANGADGVRLATARAGNVIGGGDRAEGRLVPDLVRAAESGMPLQLRNPTATRPWQHDLEPLSGYLRLAQCLLQDPSLATAWNFGPSADATLTVAQLVSKMQAIWPSVVVEREDKPQPHEAADLALDCTKALAVLGWAPAWDANTTVQRTLDWYQALSTRRQVLSRADLAAYLLDARAAGQAWAT